MLSLSSRLSFDVTDIGGDGKTGFMALTTVNKLLIWLITSRIVLQQRIIYDFEIPAIFQSSARSFHADDASHYIFIFYFHLFTS